MDTKFDIVIFKLKYSRKILEITKYSYFLKDFLKSLIYICDGDYEPINNKPNIKINLKHVICFDSMCLSTIINFILKLNKLAYYDEQIKTIEKIKTKYGKTVCIIYFVDNIKSHSLKL